MSVEKWYCRIGLRILSCKRMRENRREPAVPEEEVPVVACLDGPAWITWKKLAPIHSFCEKWLPPECLFYRTKSGCRFGEKCSYAHREVDEQPTRRSKQNDKSAVAMLKKSCWHENVREPVVYVKGHDRSGRPDKNVITSWNEDLLDVDHLTHGNWVVYFKTWSRWSLFSGWAQTRRDQSNV